jgi:hypothetical protein
VGELLAALLKQVYIMLLKLYLFRYISRNVVDFISTKLLFLRLLQTLHKIFVLLCELIELLL